jgi:TP901 family phage tail tape measure protein
LAIETNHRKEISAFSQYCDLAFFYFRGKAMETAGVRLVVEDFQTAMSQVTAFSKSLTSIGTAASQAATGLKPLDAAIREFSTAESAALQVANQFKAGMQGVSQAAGQLASAQGQTTQSANQFKAAQTGVIQELSKLRSEEAQTAQSATSLKTAEGEVASGLNQLKTVEGGAATGLNSLKQAQLENVQASTLAKQAQTEQTQETTKLRTAQTEATTTLAKLRSEQTQTAAATTQLKQAEVAEVQATTEFKNAQTVATTALANLRKEQVSVVQSTAQLKTAKTEESRATVTLKTSQSEAAIALAELRKEQTSAISSTIELKTANMALDGQLKQTRLSILQQKEAQLVAKESTGSFASALGSFATGPAGIAALAVGAVGTKVVKLASDFDSSMATVQVATGITDRQSESFKRLEAAARDVGGSTKFSATEAADGLASLAQAGLNVDDSISALPAVAKAAAVNNVTMAESATTVVVALNAFGLSASDAAKVIDVQTTAAAAGILNFNDFKEAISTVGSVAKTANQSLTETTSVLLALTNTGMSAESAGTAMKTALLSLINPSKDARKSIDELGLSVYDSEGKMRPFSDIVAQVEKNTAGMSDETKNAALANIFGTEGIRAITGAMGASTTAMVNGTKQTVNGSERNQPPPR